MDEQQLQAHDDPALIQRLVDCHRSRLKYHLCEWGHKLFLAQTHKIKPSGFLLNKYQNAISFENQKFY